MIVRPELCFAVLLIGYTLDSLPSQKRIMTNKLSLSQLSLRQQERKTHGGGITVTDSKLNGYVDQVREVCD